MEIMNKNVHHNGELFAKGSEVKSSNPMYKLFKEAGHLEEAVKASEPDLVAQSIVKAKESLVNETKQEKSK